MPGKYADGLFWAAVVCCVVAQIAIFRSIAAVRSAAGRSNAAASPSRAGGAADIVWAVAPAIALVAVLFATWRAIHSK